MLANWPADCEQDMIHRKPKLINVPISKVTLDLSRNIREQIDANYDLEPLIADIQLRGQQDAATLEIVGEQMFPVKGFRRSRAFEIAASRGLRYSDSAPQAGKPIDHILAYVYEDLSEQERTELLLDHGQRRGLNKVELHNAFERAFVAGYGDKEIITLLYSLLENHYPPSRKIGEGMEGEKLAAARLDYYKGVLQTAKRAWQAPTILREAFYKKLRGEQKWPTNSELIDLMSIHTKEIDANPMLSRDNPGPKFLEKFEAVKKAKVESVGNAPKSASMRNRTQVEDSMKVLECPISKAFQKIQLGDIAVDKMPVLDKMLVAIWNGGTLSEDAKAIIVGWFGTPEVKPEVAA